MKSISPDILRVMFKEFRISLIVGCALAAANGAPYFDYVSKPGDGICYCYVFNCNKVVISKMIGCILPLVRQKIHLDPAIMAAPLIPTLVDTCSVMVYFAIATQVFRL